MTSSKSNVAANFSAAANTYNSWAEVQVLSAKDLIAQLPESISARRGLDIGCGTGLLSRMLIERFGDLRLTGIDLAPAMADTCRQQWPPNTGHKFICTDAEAYSTDNLFDVIASNFAFQWFDNKDQTIAHFTRQLNAGGVFALSVPVEGTLCELENAYKAMLNQPFNGLRYPPADNYVTGAKLAGLKVLSQKVTEHTITYPSAMMVLKSFKEIGAVFAGRSGRKPMTPRQLSRLITTYEDLYRKNDKVPVTYQVLTLIASI